MFILHMMLTLGAVYFQSQLCDFNNCKWKNHFMKGDVLGMSLHEKEGEQDDAYTETGSH